MNYELKAMNKERGFMSPIETQEVLSEDITGASDNDNMKLVPVAESIRYRKRAQSAEKKIEALTEQLAEAKSRVAEMSEHLGNIQTEQKLTRKLAAAGAVDLETAILIAKARVEDQTEADVDGLDLPADTPIAYVTQTTLSVDDTRGIIAALFRQ